MMEAKKIALVIFIYILTLGISSAEIYKWVDENGITHYSDAPTENIPGNTETENDEIESVDPAPANPPPLPDETRKDALDSDIFDILDETQEQETQEQEIAAETPAVEIYETSWCGYCKKAKDFFRSKGIDFVTYDIEKDQQARSRMQSLTSRMAVPFVVINGQGIQGYSVAAYEQALQN